MNFNNKVIPLAEQALVQPPKEKEFLLLEIRLTRNHTQRKIRHMLLL